MRVTPFFICMLLIFFSIGGCSHSNKSSQNQSNPPVNPNQQMQTNDPYHFHGAKEAKDKVNFLIVGIDSRGEKHSRSDAIMVAQLHKKSHHLRLVSIMRDCYVDIPETNSPYKKNKINAAYYLGGPELLRQTIEKNFHFDIHHYIEIDFQGFVQMVDLLAPDGIEVRLTEAIIQDMNMTQKPGIQKLHGQELLEYARFRHDAQSDFGRIARQQEVLLALKEQLTNQISSVEGVMTMPKIAQELFKYMTTDLSIDEMLLLASDLALHPIACIETMRIPVENGFTNKRVRHAGLVLELNEELNQAAVRSFLIEAPTPVNQD